MTASSVAIAQEYVAALDAYLRAGDEETLAMAYEIGRRALVDGLGVLDAAEMHHHALGLLKVASSPAGRPKLSAAAADFFRELLSPFEMALRGYREANADLSRANGALSQQRDALEALNRELEAFSYSVSHDLRAPLRSIDGFSQALLEDCAEKLDEDGQRYLGHIRESAQRMAQLIDDLLELSRITRTPVRQADVDLTALARRIADRIQARAPDRRGRFIIQEGLCVRGDEGLLAVVMENLLGNAWKFTSRRPMAEIELGRAERDGRVYYFVRDNGAGFDPRYAGKLFGAFQRLHASSEFEGTGIGLATVQRIIHRHRGEVWAEGRVDGGATFFFTLGAEEGAP